MNTNINESKNFEIKILKSAPTGGRTPDLRVISTAL